jgi:hypothetical protein
VRERENKEASGKDKDEGRRKEEKDEGRKEEGGQRRKEEERTSAEGSRQFFV